MPRLYLPCSLPATTAVKRPQPTARARHLRQVSLSAVMGLKPQPCPNSIAIHLCQQMRPSRQAQILQGASEFTPVMTRHLRKGELFEQSFGFAALMQGDFALHEPPAEICLRRLRNTVVQRETMTRRNECTHPHGQKAQSRKRACDLLDPDPRRHGLTAAG